MNFRITDAVKHLIIINMIMFIGTLSIGNGALFYEWFSLFFPKNDSFQPWQIATHMFMHGDVPHILFNMFGLWMFGAAVEQAFGTKKFVIFYIFSGLGAALIMLIYYYIQYLPLESDLLQAGISSELIEDMLANNRLVFEIDLDQKLKLQEMFSVFNSTMVGASGAIMGILVAFGMLFPDTKLMLIFFPVPVKAKYFIPVIILLDLFSAITGNSIFSPSNTAYVAHLGGAFTGFLLMYFWKKNEKDKYRWN